jgi:hypothetical protein
MKKILFLLLIPVFVMMSCGSDSNFDVDLTGVETPQIHIKRYGKAMFAIPPDSFLTAVPRLKDEFPLFLDGDLSDTNALLQLKSFFVDRYMIELNDLVQKKFPDLTGLEKDLSLAFRHLKYYFPQFETPEFYSYISGLDLKFPVKYASGIVLISLDMYLGDNTEVYKVSGFPKYRTHWAVPQAIVPDVMKEIASGLMEEKKSNANLLENMVYLGKLAYFTKCMIPSVADTILFKYTKSQMDWVKDYEPNIWAFVLENQLLYDNDKRMIRKFTEDGPFTDYFSKKSPPRIAEYVGWCIVKKYMDETGAGLDKLLTETNAQKILKLSRYKPKL